MWEGLGHAASGRAWHRLPAPGTPAVFASSRSSETCKLALQESGATDGAQRGSALDQAESMQFHLAPSATAGFFQLSGGERRAVGGGQSLGGGSKGAPLLLLDEPFAGRLILLAVGRSAGVDQQAERNDRWDADHGSQRATKPWRSPIGPTSLRRQHSCRPVRSTKWRTIPWSAATTSVTPFSYEIALAIAGAVIGDPAAATAAEWIAWLVGELTSVRCSLVLLARLHGRTLVVRVGVVLELVRPGVAGITGCSGKPPCRCLGLRMPDSCAVVSDGNALEMATLLAYSSLSSNGELKPCAALGVSTWRWWFQPCWCGAE